MTSLSVDTPGVLWVQGRGQSAHDVMLLQSQEFKLVCKCIRSSDGDLTNVLFGHGHIIIHWLWVTMGNRSNFCLNCQNIQNNVLTYGINLKSIKNITRSKPVGGIGFVLMSVGCCQVHICAMGLSQILHSVCFC